MHTSIFPDWSQDLDLVMLVCTFQLSVFCDSMIPWFCDHMILWNYVAITPLSTLTFEHSEPSTYLSGC